MIDGFENVEVTSDTRYILVTNVPLMLLVVSTWHYPFSSQCSLLSPLKREHSEEKG